LTTTFQYSAQAPDSISQDITRGIVAIPVLHFISTKNETTKPLPLL